MSADNGIYIGKFPTGPSTYEYRVAHAQNIEDVGDDYYPDTGEATKSIRSPEAIDAIRSLVFGGDVKVFGKLEDAYEYAEKWSESFSVLEYGIVELPFIRPFVAMAEKDARKILDAAWKKYWRLDRRRKKANSFK